MAIEEVVAEAAVRHREKISAICQQDRLIGSLVNSLEVTEKYWGRVESLALKGDELKLQAKGLDCRFPSSFESTISLEDNGTRLLEYVDGTIGIVGRNPNKDGRYTQWGFTFRSPHSSL